MAKIPNPPKIDKKIFEEFAKGKSWYWKTPVTKLPRPSRLRPMADPDKDGFPNAIDCVDSDPKRQGLTVQVDGGKEVNVGGTIKSKIGGLVQRYKEKAKERKAAEPARRQDQLEALQHKHKLMLEQEKIQKTKSRIAGSMMERQRGQIAIMKERTKAMDSMPSMMGGFGSSSSGSSTQKMPNPFDPLASLNQATPSKPRKKRRKKSSKKKKKK